MVWGTLMFVDKALTIITHIRPGVVTREHDLTWTKMERAWSDNLATITNDGCALMVHTHIHAAPIILYVHHGGANIGTRAAS